MMSAFLSLYRPSVARHFAKCCPIFTFFHRHTHTHNRFTALWNLSGTTKVSRYQKKHSPTFIHRMT